MTTADRRCRWARHRLALLAGDTEGRDLRWDERRDVERHLIVCDACRAERQGFESAVSALHLAGSASPVDPEAPSLWPGLERQIRRSRRDRPATVLRLGLAPTVGLAASLLVVGGLIGLVGWRIGSASRSRPESARADGFRYPRHQALPDDRDLLTVEGRSPVVVKPELAGLDSATARPTTSGNPGDPQGSQGVTRSGH